MRSRKILLSLLVTGLAAVSAPSASAVEAEFGGSGDIAVSSDLSACASVSFPGQFFVGQFSGAAVVQGPGTRYGTTRDARVIAATGSWYGCISGTYSGATAGEAKYTLTVSSGTGEVVVAKQCVVNRGAVTCV